MDFQKKDWQFNDIITEGELNRMEDGIEEGVTKAEQAQQVAEQAQQTAESHASRHAAGGPDEITPEMIGAETPAGAQAKVDAHSAATTGVHGATPNATPSRIVMRDGNGRAAVANPVNNDHIANKQYVDGAIDAITSGDITVIPSIPDGNASGDNIPVGVTMFTISSGSTGYFYPYSLIVNFKTTNHRLTQWCFKNGDAEDGAAYRHWYTGKGWTPWYQVWDSGSLPNPARRDIDNNFTTRQTVKNGSNYEYIGVRRDVSGTEYGAEVAVSSSGYAQLVKRDNGNIVESINIRGARDARVGSDRIWHEGNLSSPARTDVDNDFTITQTFNTPNVTGNWTVLRLKRDQNGVGDYGLSMRNDGRLSIWDYINQRTLILFGDDRVVIGAGVDFDVVDNAKTTSATPTGSGNGYFRNAYIHNADPSGGMNGDVYYKY